MKESLRLYVSMSEYAGTISALLRPRLSTASSLALVCSLSFCGPKEKRRGRMVGILPAVLAVVGGVQQAADILVSRSRLLCYLCDSLH